MKSSNAIGTGSSARSLFEGLENRLLFAAFGTPDAGFGVAARAFAPFAGTTKTPAVQQMLITTGGKILAGGTTGLARFTSTGDLDSTFGASGKVALSSAATFLAEAVDPSNGKIYVIVSAHGSTGLLRYSADGKVDSAYGSGGTVAVTADKKFSPQAMAVQSDGKVVIAGVFQTDSGDGRKVRVYRLGSDGSSDSGFGTSGIKEFNFGVGTFLAPVAYDRVAKVAIVSGNKIDIIGGSTTYSPASTDPDTGDFIEASYDKGIAAVARLTSTGALDSSYNSTGIARVTVANSDQVQAEFNGSGLDFIAAVRGDGSVLVSSRADNAVVTEFNASGGSKYTAFATAGSQLDAPLAMVALADGRSVLVTDSDRGSALSFAALSSKGDFGNVIFSNDSDGQTNDINANNGAAAITSSDGQLLLAGSDGSTRFEVEKFSVGKATDARPDEFFSGTVNDIATDSGGGLHLAYYDVITTHLMYAHRSPSGLWDKTITLDANPKSGQFLSLDLNSKGKPGIAYYDGTNGDLKLAQLVGTKWKFEVVESKGNVGVSPSLDYDNADEPVITYYKPSTKRLNFAIKKSNLKWSYETVDTSGDDVGRSNTLVVSPTSNRYTVAYTDDTSKQVKWAKHVSAGVWQIKTAAKTTGGADFVSMAYGSSYQPMIAFFDKATADLKISSFYSGVFNVKAIATAGVQGSYTASFFNSYYSNGQIFAYNKTKNQVTLFRDVNSNSPTADRAANAGGQYLSVSYFETTDLAFVDPNTGKLKVRPTVNP